MPGSDNGHPSLAESFRYARKGFFATLWGERNFKLMVVCAVLAVSACWLLGVSAQETCIVLLCCGAVVAGELFNTALEHVVDLASPSWHELAGAAKDAAAAAVWWLSLMSALVGLLVFGGRVLELLA